MSTFAGLKRRKTNFEELEKQFETKKQSGDDRFYYPERDDQGNGFAVIRFLPTGVDTPPFVKYYSHKFKGISGWYWQNCRTTLGEDCPCCELNRATIEPFGSWDATPEREKGIVRNRKRSLSFVSNIYVVKDTATPENEGKVFLFRYGSKIMDKIKSAIRPEFEDEPQFDPFNPWEGANFVLKIKKVKGQTNYDSSAFDKPSALFDNDKDIEALAEKLYDLSEFTVPEFFAPYDRQLAALNRALGISDRERNQVSPDAPVEAAPSAGFRAPAPVAPEAVTSDLADKDELSNLFDDDDDVPF